MLKIRFYGPALIWILQLYSINMGKLEPVNQKLVEKFQVCYRFLATIFFKKNLPIGSQMMPNNWPMANVAYNNQKNYEIKQRNLLRIDVFFCLHFCFYVLQSSKLFFYIQNIFFLSKKKDM